MQQLSRLKTWFHCKEKDVGWGCHRKKSSVKQKKCDWLDTTHVVIILAFITDYSFVQSEKILTNSILLRKTQKIVSKHNSLSSKRLEKYVLQQYW